MGRLIDQVVGRIDQCSEAARFHYDKWQLAQHDLLKHADIKRELETLIPQGEVSR